MAKEREAGKGATGSNGAGGMSGSSGSERAGLVDGRLSVRKAYKLYIGGAFVRSESGRYLQMPLDRSKGVGGAENFPRASRKDAREAVVAARAAFDGWSRRTAMNRGQILYRMGEMMEARRAELELSLAQGGAADPAGEVSASIDRVIAYAGWADKFHSLLSSLNPVAGPHFDFTYPEPMGVVAIVAPSRPALLGLVGALLPVLTSGNTAVVLASEDDLRTPLVLGEILATSDLPGGVVNLLTAHVSEVLPHLAKHMEVAALDLNGVDPAVQRAAEEAATGSVKRVRARSLTPTEWHDAERTESPIWIERFVEQKTVWHPAGP